ncbi:Uncharacterized protein dnm_098420 [Desulfonema magnum]|uniref:Uncharacterized protein n=1 Tax=Desulfonema magnum TaxID=45655 RepID=A0A975BZG7_9BACT|nr:Uncharacterized protein dnm_098420 [Desulfonema magnum]
MCPRIRARIIFNGQTQQIEKFSGQKECKNEADAEFLQNCFHRFRREFSRTERQKT